MIADALNLETLCSRHRGCRTVKGLNTNSSIIYAIQKVFGPQHPGDSLSPKSKPGNVSDRNSSSLAAII